MKTCLENGKNDVDGLVGRGLLGGDSYVGASSQGAGGVA